MRAYLRTMAVLVALTFVFSLRDVSLGFTIYTLGLGLLVIYAVVTLTYYSVCLFPLVYFWSRGQSAKRFGFALTGAALVVAAVGPSFIGQWQTGHNLGVPVAPALIGPGNVFANRKGFRFYTTSDHREVGL